MKGTFLGAVVGAALMAGGAWADCTVGTDGTTACCWWNETSCWGIGNIYAPTPLTEASCLADYGIVQSNCNTPVLEYCKWPDGCYKIGPNPTTGATKEDERENCVTNAAVYSDDKCKNYVEGKEDPSLVLLGCCNWDGNGCFKVYDATQWADCAEEYKYSTCAGDAAGTCPAPTPISKFDVSAANGFKVAQVGNSLMVIANEKATVYLFDSKGRNLVLSQNISGGSNSLNLTNQKQGVYYAVVQSGTKSLVQKVVIK